jgi:hypothetical protein
LFLFDGPIDLQNDEVAAFPKTVTDGNNKRKKKKKSMLL